MLNKAIEIAARAHAGQVDKGGSPYILHPLRVMLNCKGEVTKISAVLHDVIEDSNITVDDLRAEGFSDEVLDALNCLTKCEGDSYDLYIDRILSNETACRVKLADLCDNMDLTRIGNPTENDKARIEKYRLVRDRISEALPFADEIPSARLIHVEGTVEIPPYISHGQFLDMFLAFIESHGWFFGGGTFEVTDESK